jgi:acyl carrier protein phosphodiesterase
MNFLAHLFLSPANEKIVLGNFFADMVKGKAINTFHPTIKEGILLHRKIDAFTDNHPVFLESANRLKPKYRMYSKVIVDIYYDHFLARLWDDFTQVDLTDFVQNVYRLLALNYLILPKRAKRILPYMITQNWLASYASFRDLERVFWGMSRRSSYNSGMENAVEDLQKDHLLYQHEFQAFFPDIIDFVQKLNLSNKKPG